MDSTPRAPAPLSEDNARFLATGESITVASRDVRRVPSLMKAAGCRVSGDRRQVTVFLDATQSRQLLADIAASAAIAVVFSRPSTHYTLQVKGSDACVGQLVAGDAALVAGHRQAFARELVPLGHRRDWALAIHDVPVDALVAVTYTVDAVFVQTPGPGAGARVESTP